MYVFTPLLLAQSYIPQGVAAGETIALPHFSFFAP